ncbi:MAG: TRZ/ATZ family hydrolase [Candidatus Accumulibacter sp.]|jgi:Cytosine deaminase and related metal-dependent hydrolases|nr:MULTISPECIES: TRZ/ATZ family hydrolase [unclassified Candidatus Accumulibacter]MBL8369100.1 TRZ/ATZ family hydrolase [Accumulibacter sp.]MBN8512916.1 TRZ/ATZ family hydrolase [Accumulibacter sp.]MBO3703634.1 TRZ/ATZ family hydrolase [Accumulibacter sp.]HRE69936.1 TRZ/ATZ family hydrolase [Accumulibacter sp.]HRI92646.1 TRZ/ATZ family hydrolase [Accumulibacter sp.]
MPMEVVDLLIEARWIVPVDPAGVVLESHAVVINDGRIVAVVPQSEAASCFSARSHKRLEQHVLIPGLVNLHTHAAMTLLRGLADDLPLMEWLQRHVWPAEAQHVSEQFVYDGTLLACAEMLRGGITCFNDMYFFPGAAADAALASGMRAAIGLITVDFPSSYATDADDYLAKGLAARDQRLEEPLLSFCLAPHAPYTVGDGGFSRVLTLAEQVELPIHVHLHETIQEIEESVQRFGIRPIERLRRLGMLSPALIAVHAVHLDAHEIELLAQQGCSIAHCPSSNLKLASGIAPLAELAAKGINIGLGTDGAASNNRLDLLQEMRLAALLAKAQSGRADAIKAHQVLHMATLGGARALGLEARIGSITPGKAADLCAVALDEFALAPCYEPVSHLTYAVAREHVSAVWVAGRMLVENGQLIESNETGLIKLALLWQNKIRP